MMIDEMHEITLKKAAEEDEKEVIEVVCDSPEVYQEDESEVQ